MKQTVIDSSHAGLFPSKRRAIAVLTVCSLPVVWVLASLFVHLLPHQVSDRASAPLLPGADIPPSVVGVIAHACVNCHSEKTQWPWYSRVAPVSWLVENDVKHAREHLNLSRWDDLQQVDQRMLLTAMATVIENHEMPPHKYVVLHPEAKLSADDAVRVIEWTRAERRRLRESASNMSAK
jgi:Haem-binding domain